MKQGADRPPSRGAAPPGNDFRGAARAFFSVALAVGAFATVAYATGTTVCPLKRLTGVPCASCGSTRAAFSLLSGDVPAAFAFNPLAALLMVVAVPAAALSCAIFGVARTKAAVASFFRSPLSWILVVASLCANWAYVIWHGN